MSSGTMKFNGYLRVRIGEAVGLQPTRWSLRHSLFKKGYQLLDPYLTVSVDQVRVGQTSTKQKTNKPTYNEEFCANVTDGGHLELAVFHETPLGYDHFVANCTLQFQELLRTAGASDTFEGWLGGGGNSLQTFVFAQVAVALGDGTAVDFYLHICEVNDYLRWASELSAPDLLFHWVLSPGTVGVKPLFCSVPFPLEESHRPTELYSATLQAVSMKDCGGEWRAYGEKGRKGIPQQEL
ncbi:Protein kinase C eta type [Galemys pyrenaicus]|uniref:Protein kinase C eta type n=1 Tax=Galemys pyrenaicus TaxID=202257 RepID=A0A8J6A455_GALPY|nr:Protein kinase C eta type [Galemys pyrenaicus]